MASTWTGSANTDWDNAGNWSPNGVPNFDNVTIPGTVSGTVVNILSTDPQESADNLTIGNSGTATLNNAGALEITGTLAVAASGTLANTGSMQVSGIATIAGTLTDSGTAQFESATTVAANGQLQIGSTGHMTLNGTTDVIGAIVDNGSLTANQAVTVASTGTFTVATGATANLTSTLTVNGGGEVGGGGGLMIEGAATVDSSISGSGPITVDGGSLAGPSGEGVVFASGATNTVTVENGGDVALQNAPPAGVSIAFGGNSTSTPNTLTLPANITLSNPITGFGPGDEITTGQTGQTGSIHDNGNGTYTITIGGVTLSDVTLAPGVTEADITFGANGEITACFAEGTLIGTDRGEVAVEHLVVGDRVMTLSGAYSAVRWIGHRRIDLTTYHRPEMMAPIRFRRGAIADNVPARDLYVSPDHAVLVDGLLIPAHQLVNGATILQERAIRAVRYFHVELERHDILLAEGMPAESYLDTGNRGWFISQGSVVALRPGPRLHADPQVFAAAGGLPQVTDAAALQPIWQRLADRAASRGRAMRGIATTQLPSLRLLVDGQEIAPLQADGMRYQFLLPRGAEGFRLQSRAARPSDIRPWLNDRRPLGVAVRGMSLRMNDYLLTIPMHHDSLDQGWWAVERLDALAWRWTNGDALVPLAGLLGYDAVLDIELQAVMDYALDDQLEPMPLLRSA